MLAGTPHRVPGEWAVPVFASSEYGGVIRDCLVAYKERQARHLAPILGRVLARSVAAAALGLDSVPLVLTPLPSDPATVAQRGDDVVKRLVRVASVELGRLGVPALVDASLRHRRSVADQSGLGVAARLANLSGSMVARPRGAGVRIVVDDIVTTGSSLAEATRALLQAGVPVGCAAVISATPRLHPKPR